MFVRQSGTGFADPVLHSRTQNQQLDRYGSAFIPTTTDYYRKNLAVMKADKRTKLQPARQKSLNNHTSNEIIKVIPTFKVHNETESSQIETLQGIAEQLVAHFNDQELEGLQFSSTTIPGSQLMTVPKNQEYMKKFQSLFHVGNFKIVQSYLDKDQLVLVIARTADSILSDFAMHGSLNPSLIQVNRTYDYKFAPSSRITKHNKPSNCLQEISEKNETTKFIHHRRSSDYFTLYDEIEKVGALGDIATIARVRKMRSAKEECPIRNLDGDSGYMSSLSGDSPGSPDTSGEPGISTKSGKVTHTVSTVPEIHRPSWTISTHSAVSTRLPIERSVNTADPTGGPDTLYSSYQLPERLFTVFPSSLPKPSVDMPTKTIGSLHTPGNGSKLPISRKKGLSNCPLSACNVAPVVKPIHATRISNRTKPNWSTPPTEFDITERHSRFKAPTTKSPKKPLKNYAKLRKQAVKINSIDNPTNIGTAQTASSRGDQQPSQSGQIEAQRGEGSIPTLCMGKYSPDSSLPQGLAPSKDQKTEVKVKQPLKNFKKARLLQSENSHQDRQIRINGDTGSDTTQPTAGKLGGYLVLESVTASPLCSSIDPAKAQGFQSRCSSASSIFDEFPPGPIPTDPKIKKPLKNFQKIRTQAIDPRKKLSSNQLQSPDINRTPTQMKQQSINFSSLSAIGRPDLGVTPTQSYISGGRAAFTSAAHKPLTHNPAAFTLDRVSQTTRSRSKNFTNPKTEDIGSGNTERLLITMDNRLSVSSRKAANPLSLSPASSNIVISPKFISPSAASKPSSPPNVNTISVIRDTTPLQYRKLLVPAIPHRTGNFITPTRVPNTSVSISSPATKVNKDSYKPQPTQLSDTKNKNLSKVRNTIASKQNSRPTHFSDVHTTSKKLANPIPRSPSRLLSALHGPVRSPSHYQHTTQLSLAYSTPRGMSACKTSHVARAPPKRSEGPAITPVMLTEPNKAPSSRGKSGVSSARRSSKASCLRNLT